MTRLPLLRRSEVTIEPAPAVFVHGVGGDLRFMDIAAFGASQGPVLESGARRGNALNMQVRLAFETAGPLRRARRQSGHVWIGHRASLHWTGALPNSLSPKNAKGGAAMRSVCTRRVPGCWSILLTREEFGRGRRFWHRWFQGTIQRNHPKELSTPGGLLNHVASVRQSRDELVSTVRPSANLMVEIGHFPSWPMIEIRRP
jgi:hypothetical protein